MSKPQRDKPPEVVAVPEETILFTGMCREGCGWSLYRLRIPKSWLADAEQITEGDSLAACLQKQRYHGVVEAQS